MNIPRSISETCKTSSLLHQVKARYRYYEYSSFYTPTTQKTSSRLHQVKARYSHYEYSSFYKPTAQKKLVQMNSKL